MLLDSDIGLWPKADFGDIQAEDTQNIANAKTWAHHRGCCSNHCEGFIAFIQSRCDSTADALENFPVVAARAKNFARSKRKSLDRQLFE
jgi:hypothetical protein